jgi:ABC-type branched-subunit amino acid transport system substrate-binding protein
MRIDRYATLALTVLAASATACSREVRVGALISQTGPVAPYGERARKGLDLALQEINAGGGFEGRDFALVYHDDATDPEIGRQTIYAMIERDKLGTIIGGLSSQVALSVAPICEKHHVVLLSPSASAPEISQAGSYIFRNYPSDVLEGTTMGQLARELQLARVAIFALDNEFGGGLREVFTRGYQDATHQVVKNFFIDESPSYEPMIEELKQLQPDGIYIVCYVEQQAELLRRIHAAGIRATLLSSGSVIEDLTRLSGPEAAEGLIYAQPNFDLASTDGAVAAFVSAYRGKYNEDPDIYAAHAYDALKLVFEAVRRSGSARAEDVRDGLNAIKDYAGAAGKTSFDKNGDVVREPRLFVIQGGQPVPYLREPVQAEEAAVASGS